MDHVQLKTLEHEIANTQVVILAGGKAKRLNCPDTPKAMLELGGRPLIDICLEQYGSCGFRDFVFLLRHLHEQIEKHVGNGSDYGIKTKYSIEPKDGMGKGKALKFAVKNGSIDHSKRCIVCFPDDLLLDKNLPIRLLLHHLYGVEKFGCSATVVFVSGTEYPYGVGKVDKDGILTDFVEKPFIQELTSTGIYVLEPSVYKTIEKTVNLEEDGPVEFEKSTLPELAAKKKVYSMVLPSGCWLSINTQKEYENAEKTYKNVSKK